MIFFCFCFEFDDDGDEFFFFFHRSQEVIAREAIKHALKALRKRHLLEEGAHAPAFIAISGPIASQVLLSLAKLVIFWNFDFVLLVNFQIVEKCTPSVC